MRSLLKILRQAPLFRLAIPFACGIFWAENIPNALLLGFALIAILGYGIGLVMGRKQQIYHANKLITVCMYATAFAIGSIFLKIHHLSYIDFFAPNQTPTAVVGILSSPPKTTAKGSNRCQLRVIGIYTPSGIRRTEELVLAYFPKKTTPPTPYDTVYATLVLQPITTDHEGYAAYLHRNGISRRAFVRDVRIGGKEASIAAAAYALQQRVGRQFASIIPDSTIAGVALAMFVGDTNHLDSDLRADFATAGLSHILAISGMHVGIVYLLLSYLLKISGLPISNRIKHGIVLVLLLAYMLLTGASPSVVRAVVMFGTLLVAKMLYLHTRTLNLLGFSALLQLIISPDVLFHVGFQLSYGAVAGIVMFYPLLERATQTPFPSMNHVFSWMNLTLSAQVFTAPIIIGTFGTFPTYFLLSNIAICVVATATTFVGFCALLLAYVPFVNILLGWLTFILLRSMSGIAMIFARLPHASIQHFSPTDGGVQLLFLQLLGIGGIVWGAVHVSKRYALQHGITLQE